MTTESYFTSNYPDKCYGDLYFPEDLYGDGTNRHMSNALNVFHEPSLYKSVSYSRIAYRFLYLRSFHGPVSVRIEIDGTCRYGVVIMKHLSSEIDRIGFPESLYVQPLSPEQITQTLKIMNHYDFWQTASHGNEETETAQDGARWLIEGVQNGKYHLVDRHSPKEGPARELGLYFLELANLADIEIY